VDPDNTLIETDKKNNQMKDTVNVRGRSDIIPGFESLFVLAAMALTLAVALFRRRR